METLQVCTRRAWRPRFARPQLDLWSVNLSEDQAPDLMGQARHDFEREARISQLGFLTQSFAATPLWRRVCMHAMCGEIRERSVDQRLAMELALLEAARGHL